MADNTIQQELVALTDNAGFIKPHSVVEWARTHPESYLHKRFEWNNKRAADQYRLDQARQLIAVYVRSDDGHRSTISLVQDRSQFGGYRSVGHVMSNAELREIALKQALAEFHRWRDKYQYLRELARIFEAAAEFDRDPVRGSNELSVPGPEPGLDPVQPAS